MDNAALAQSFNKTSLALGAQGHRVVVRRARSLVEAGDVESAVAFLDEAARLSSLNEARDLAARLQAWQAAGGAADALCAEAAWGAGATHDAHTAELIVQATSGDLGGLFNELLDQSRAARTGLPLPAAQPPEAPSAHAIGSIFGDEPRPPATAAVEAASNLQARSLELDMPEAVDDATAAMNDAVRAIADQETPPPLAAPSFPTPPPPQPAPESGPLPLPLPEVATQGVVQEATDFGEPISSADSFEVPDLPVPPSTPVVPTPPATTKKDEGGSPMVMVLGLLAAAAIGAAIWFFTK